MLTYADLRDKSVTDLHDLLAEKRQAVREFRFQASERQLKNVRAIRVARREVAMILTALRLSAAKATA